MREKVATLIEMTQRSEEEVCCALNECDNNLERAVVFLLETLPVVSSKTCLLMITPVLNEYQAVSANKSYKLLLCFAIFMLQKS